MYENKYVITEAYFDKFSQFDWRKYLIKIWIDIEYHSYSNELYFKFVPEYDIHDNYREYKLFSHLQTDVIDKLQHIFYQKKGYDITNHDNYNKIFTTEDIYDLFHPLLLHSFKQYKIILNDRELISNNFFNLIVYFRKFL